MADSNSVVVSYSPEEVSVVLSNDKFSYVVSGYADGTFISISRQVPHATLYVGGDSSAARVIRKNTASTVTLTLAGYSEGNDVLTELFNQDVLDSSGTNCFSVLIQDGLGRSKFYSSKAFISTPPEHTFGTDMGTVAWAIMTIDAETTIGGNTKIDPSAVDAITDIGGSVDSRWIKS